MIACEKVKWNSQIAISKWLRVKKSNIVARLSCTGASDARGCPSEGKSPLTLPRRINELTVITRVWNSQILWPFCEMVTILPPCGPLEMRMNESKVITCVWNSQMSWPFCEIVTILSLCGPLITYEWVQSNFSVAYKHSNVVGLLRDCGHLATMWTPNYVRMSPK